MSASLFEFFRGVREELRKVVWPSRELVIKASIAVVLFTAFFSVYLWLWDLLFVKIISLVFNNL
ncbi:MAG: preprotein translocase subunit SecE [Aquificae bacterium]|nr:preprotein translocase subunit SecE [Aquificota bacterium]